MRVLGRIRLSRLTEESTSTARQREIIQQWADANDHKIVGWAEDLDVSGSVDPFKAPALAPWLKGERQHDWDILCCWKLDRLTRSAIKLNELIQWCLDHGKTITSCAESIDISTPTGRLIANVIGFLAEGELEAIKERTRGGRKKVVESGRWPGGPAPFGFEPVPLAGGGYKLKPRDDQAAVIRAIYEYIVSGLSMEAVAKRLNHDGVKSAQGTSWRSSVLFVMMESKLLLGHSTYKGQTVRDAEGRPVMVSAPILTEDEFDKLQAAIAARRLPGTAKRTQNTSPLYGVVFCYSCDSMLYHRKYKGEYKYEYYTCPNSCGRMIHAKAINTALEQVFLSEVGAGQVRERVYIPAESHESELKDAQRAVDEIMALFGTITSDTLRKQLTGQITALDARVKVLESMPRRESHWEYRATGKTYAEAWESADTADARRALLVKSGIKLAALKSKTTPTTTLKLSIPKNIVDGMGLDGKPQAGSITESFAHRGIAGVEIDPGRFVDTAIIYPVDGGDPVELHVLTDEGEAEAAKFYGWDAAAASDEARRRSVQSPGFPGD